MDDPGADAGNDGRRAGRLRRPAHAVREGPAGRNRAGEGGCGVLRQPEQAEDEEERLQQRDFALAAQPVQEGVKSNKLVSLIV